MRYATQWCNWYLQGIGKSEVAVVDVTKRAVESALEEFRRIGLDTMVEKYGGGLSTRWYVEVGSHRFDLKVLLRAAHVHQGLGDLPPRDAGRFNARDARRHLGGMLGYRVPQDPAISSRSRRPGIATHPHPSSSPT